MQTIKVTLPTTVQGGKLDYSIDGKVIAEVYPDFFNTGKYCGRFGVFCSCNNTDLSGAVEYVSGYIKRFFAKYNIEVVFDVV